MSVKAALESYSHIELTQEETDSAILQAKVKKSIVLEDIKRQERIRQNREALMLVNKGFSFDQMFEYIKYRAKVLYENKVYTRPFEFDKSNKDIIELLCLYFANDPLFEKRGFDLTKGICLVGVPGVGKSWLMKLFTKNPRNCFYIRDCKEISIAYQQNGGSVIDEYSFPIKPAVNDSSVFYQQEIGICFSDVGTEDIKNNFGNKSNVLADIFFNRYKNNLPRILTHAETNLSAEQIGEFYGQRIRSRFAEMFNWIVVSGNDRRKD